MLPMKEKEIFSLREIKYFDLQCRSKSQSGIQLRKGNSDFFFILPKHISQHMNYEHLSQSRAAKFESSLKYKQRDFLHLK